MAVKTCLIYLPHPYLKEPDAQAPLGLMYLAAMLEAAGLPVVLQNFSKLLTYQAIEELQEADIYGITVTSLEIPQANRFACLIKEKYPQSKVFIGGPGAISSEFVDWNFIDSVCIGEGEFTILKMVEEINNLKRIYTGERIKTLDGLPFPARHLLQGNQGGNIFAYGKHYRSSATTIILTSRGCPFNCSFCSSPKLGRGVRFRSPENVYKEIKFVKEQFGISQFRISDDMFLADPKRALEICKLVKELDIVWRISTRVKPFTKELAEALFAAGCKEISFGVESFDNHVLQVLKKGTTAEDNATACHIAKDAGMVVRILFMIRTPGQTSNTVPINIEWLEKIPYDIIACSSFVPIPGCDIWYHPENYGVEILSRNLDDYNFYFFGRSGENLLKDVIKLDGRSLEELNAETVQFRNYLKDTGKVNKG